KPLRPPPVGLRWHRLHDGAWELQPVPPKVDDSIGQQETPPAFLEHIVMPEDTLIGLCLRYKVS
ncbi:unnamed protein product, partial [Discosporangium mesarthrocarpum]